MHTRNLAHFGDYTHTVLEIKNWVGSDSYSWLRAHLGIDNRH